MFKIGREDGKPGRILTGYYNFVMRRDRAVLNDLKSRDLMHPSFTISKAIGLACAGLIHLSTIILPFIGIWIILSKFAGVFSVCYGLLIFGAAYVIRPQFSKKPSEILPRAKYPTLYEFVDRLSDALHAPHVDNIVINEHTNASLGAYGLRQSIVLTIGYPLWISLDDQQRVALIGHELAHQINKDFTRTLFVGTALDTLINWYQLVYPDALVTGQSGIFTIPANLALWTIANGIFAIYIGLSQIFLYEKRRAEYLADYIGAAVGGTENMISVVRWFQRSNPTVNINALTTHPSYDFRIEFLNSKPKVQPQFTLEAAYSKRIDGELSQLRARMENRMRRNYKSHGY